LISWEGDDSGTGASALYEASCAFVTQSAKSQFSKGDDNQKQLNFGLDSPSGNSCAIAEKLNETFPAQWSEMYIYHPA